MNREGNRRKARAWGAASTRGGALALTITGLLSSAPIVALLLLGVSATSVRIGLGAWPRPFVDSLPPEVSGLTVSIAVAIALLAIPSILVLPLILAVRRFAGLRPVWDKRIWLFLVGWAILVLLVLVDPFRFLTWAVD
jgi:hypothetical protein